MFPHKYSIEHRRALTAAALTHGLAEADALWQLRNPDPHIRRINWTCVDQKKFYEMVREGIGSIDIDGSYEEGELEFLEVFISKKISIFGDEGYLICTVTKKLFRREVTKYQYFVNSLLLSEGTHATETAADGRRVLKRPKWVKEAEQLKAEASSPKPKRQRRVKTNVVQLSGKRPNVV